MSTPTRQRGKSIELLINSIFGSPWLWGTGVTFIFYACLPYIPAEDTQRYFTAHWIEYATTGLFFIGVCTLIGKLSRIPTERGALQTDLLEGLSSNQTDDAVTVAHAIETHFKLVAKRYEDTLLVKRVREACEYVGNRRSSDGLEGHLTYLAEVNSGRQHDGYALIRTITWAVPILGFLGTVIGITMAIANITPDKLESSLPEVTAGLAVAFDTTALSLALSMLLVFGTFIIERIEQRTLDDIEDFGMKRLLSQFPNSQQAAPASPLVVAEQQAAEQLLQRSESLINWQMDMWQTSLESLRERWTGTLSKQQEYLDQALQTGLTNALIDHSRQLAEVRSEFISAFQSTSTSIGDQLAETRSVLADQQQQGIEQIALTWQQFRAEITQTRDEHARQLALLTQAITAEVGGWQNQLESSTRTMNGQFEELRSQGEVFLKLSENESQLIRLENRLAENLESVRLVDSLEQTMLNLNAAVNLLTTRVKPKAA
ncbi:MotA/TolQ/ExbB proton channel family protein [Schlesneria paludicola]|uniref:MotA/TolQ/ExbB proton channel family protein n=1 Tax=Schlesneria paludicola TaxID=360056 RepID=UPI00029B18AA|nr:MotA/TolQ/ExbB proton channel family protein [Schlesneria paludicola]